MNKGKKPAMASGGERGSATRVNLIKTVIEALPAAPPDRRLYFTDTKIRGLQLVVTERGVKSWYLYRRTGAQHRPVRHFLGHYPDLSTDLARRKADTWRGSIASGNDPSAERRAARAQSVTLEDAFKEFRAARGTRLKAATLANYQRFLDTVFAEWKARPLVSITKDSVGSRHRKLTEASGPAHADHAMRFLRALINFARHRYEAADGTPLIPENPVARLSQTKAWNQPKRRTTLIKSHQLADWFRGLAKLREGGSDTQGALVADYLEPLILTGLRRSEAAQLQRQDIDVKGRTLTVRDTKNREDHTLPLSDRLLEIVKGRLEHAAADDPHAFLFPGSGAAGYLVEPRPQMQRVTTESGVAFTLHDLRRTFSTIAESLDIPAYALKRLLNHKMRNDVTAGYVVADVERLRKPMQAVTDYMLRAAGLKPSADVTPLPAERVR